MMIDSSVSEQVHKISAFSLGKNLSAISEIEVSEKDS